MSSLVPLCSLIVVSTCTEQAVYISLGYRRVESICFMNFNSQSSGEILPEMPEMLKCLWISAFHITSCMFKSVDQLVSCFLCLCVCACVFVYVCVFLQVCAKWQDTGLSMIIITITILEYIFSVSHHTKYFLCIISFNFILP